MNFADGAPNGNSKASLYIEDSNMVRTSALITGVKPPQVVERDLFTPSFLEKGGKMEEEYNDDFTDSVAAITLVMVYCYEQMKFHG